MEWPASLPNPLLRGYSWSYRMPVIRTEMETGPRRVSRTSTVYENVFTIRFVMDNLQFATFQSFYDNTANTGADWVDIPLDSGSGINLHRCRFMAVSVTAVSQDLFNVVCTIETDERVLL